MKTTIHLLAAALVALLSGVRAEDVPEGSIDTEEIAAKPDPSLIPCPNSKCVKPIPIVCPKIKCPFYSQVYYSPKTRTCKCVPCRKIYCPLGQKGEYMPSSGICRCRWPRPLPVEKREAEAEAEPEPEPEPEADPVARVSPISCPVYVRNPCEPGYTYNSNPLIRPCGCYPTGGGYPIGDGSSAKVKRSAEPKKVPDPLVDPKYPEPEISPCALVRCRAGTTPYHVPGTRRCICVKEPPVTYKLKARDAEAQDPDSIPPPSEGTGFPPQCIAVTCPVNTNVVWDPVKKQCNCIPVEPTNPCALILCVPGKEPRVDPATNTCKCVPPKPAPCPLLCQPGTHPIRDPKTKKCRCWPCVVKCPFSQSAYYDDSLKRCTCPPWKDHAGDAES